MGLKKLCGKVTDSETIPFEKCQAKKDKLVEKKSPEHW